MLRWLLKKIFSASVPNEEFCGRKGQGGDWGRRVLPKRGPDLEGSTFLLESRNDKQQFGVRASVEGRCARDEAGKSLGPPSA